MQVRTLTEEDAETFWELRLSGFREAPESFGSSYDEERHRPVSVAREMLSHRQGTPDDFFLGAFEDNRLVGIVGLLRESRRKRSHRAKLKGLYVVPEARGSGVGRALVAALLERARRITGLEQVLLTVMAHNGAAQALYSSFGFERYGLEPRAMKLDGRYYDEVSMLLWLDRA